MKLTIYILMLLAIVLMIFNFSQINFEELKDEKNTVAFIGVIGSSCAFLLLLIFKISNRIFDRFKD